MTKDVRCPFLYQTPAEGTTGGRWICCNDHLCDMPCKAKDRSLCTPGNRDDYTVICKARKNFKRL